MPEKQQPKDNKEAEQLPTKAEKAKALQNIDATLLLSRMLKDSFPDGLNIKDEDKAYKAIFEKLDRDGSGELGFREVKTYAKSLSKEEYGSTLKLFMPDILMRFGQIFVDRKFSEQEFVDGAKGMFHENYLLKEYDAAEKKDGTVSPKDIDTVIAKNEKDREKVKADKTR